VEHSEDLWCWWPSDKNHFGQFARARRWVGLHLWSGGNAFEHTNSPHEGDRIDFHFDEQGHKTATQRFGLRTFERARTTAYGVSVWEAADSGGGVPIGGSIVSIYDGHDEPAEARVLDSAGQTVTRFIRTFDANGRVVEVNQELENPGLMFANMFSAEDQAKNRRKRDGSSEWAKAILSGLRGSGSSYSYDAHGRIVESRECNFAFEKITAILYNAQGDKAEERRTITSNCAFPAGVSIGIDENGARFSNSTRPVSHHRPACPMRIPNFSTAINTTATATGWS
jgi:hypothetical protein